MYIQTFCVCFVFKQNTGIILNILFYSVVRLFFV